MTDAAFETQAGKEVAANVPDSKFPQQIEVTVTLVVEVSDQTNRNYWLEPATGKPSLDATADIFDMFCENLEAVESVNGFTYEQIQQAMSKREV